MRGNKDQANREQTSANYMDGPKPSIERTNKEAFDSSLLGIITARPLYSETGEVVDFEYLTANSALLRTHGISPDEIVGKTMLAVFPELGTHPTFAYYCDVATSGEPIVFESDFKSDELDIYVLVSVSRPEPDYISITFVEVSETIRITDALADLNALSGTQVDLENYIEGAMKIGLRAFYASHAFQLTLRDRTYVVSRHFGEDDIPLTRKPLPVELVLAFREDDQVRGVRNVRNHLDAASQTEDIGPYQSFVGVPFSISTETDSVLIFCSTVVKRREFTPSELKLVRTLAEAVVARIRLDAATRALEQRNEDLQRYASLVSHDLKAPLRSIRLLSEMLVPYLVEDDQANTIIAELQENADQAQNMIKALRDFSRLGAAGLQLEIVDVKQVVDDCLKRLAAVIDVAKARVEVSGAGRVFVDRILLSQVFSNLITNALSYGARPDLEIKLECVEQPDGLVLMSITDNGRGVDHRYSDRIFEMFRRVPGSEKFADGEGVGLATCRKIVESLGGKIWLDSEFTSGARFCLTLPRAD